MDKYVEEHPVAYESEDDSMIVSGSEYMWNNKMYLICIYVKV